MSPAVTLLLAYRRAVQSYIPAVMSELFPKTRLPVELAGMEPSGPTWKGTVQ